MSATAARGRRRPRADHDEEEHENEERWLVSFADMMTLLFCLFMVLFAISSVNTSKFESLKRSLQSSFNGRVLTGGERLMQTGARDSDATDSAREQPTAAIMPTTAVAAAISQPQVRARADAAAREQESFRELKRRIDSDVSKLGLADKVQTRIRDRGLVVRLLTDGVLFSSGSATLEADADRLLSPLAGVIADERQHPVVVEGYTDDQPIHGTYPSNWELSGARAARVVRQLITDGVAIPRLSASQYADQHPVASNATPEGRAENRRVEIVLTRINPSIQGGTTP